MKCLVLAGGSGDALWPLSRRNYPKQFMHVNKGRSLFQEAIARNLPFCDEFYIVTNQKYENIVRGQLQSFQGLNYHLFLEEIGRQTAPAVMVACLCMEPKEQVLVVSTDHRLEGGDYNGTIIRAQQDLTEDVIVAIGCKGQLSCGHNYFDVYDDGQVDYMSASAREEGTCETYMGTTLPDRGAERYLDSGIFLVYAGTFVKAVRQNRPKLYEACCHGRNRMRIDGGNAVLTKEWLETIPSVSVGDAVYEKWTQDGKVKIVYGDFDWSRLLNLETLAEIVYEGQSEHDLLYQCENVSIINEAKEKLVVANDLKDVLIVNTKDAVYVTAKGSSAQIKTILATENEFTPQQKAAFDEGDVYYTTWGCKETLSRSEGYMVKKLTIFPGQKLSLHKHEKRSEHWSIVSGTATIVLGDEEKEYHTKESIFVPMGVFHRISNETTKDLVVIEVSIGESVSSMTEDMVHPPRKDYAPNEILKLAPVYKDYLWGGNRLSKLYGFGTAEEMIAESWQLSAHPAGMCKVQGGSFDGMTFGSYLSKVGKEALGWKCQPYERFPLLVKLIDATDKLSIQVHPDDAYAMAYENDYGKNEMWYILDAKEDAYVYLGFEKDTTKEEVEQRIAEGTLPEILHKVLVKTGDSVFVPAGQIHAIGAGVLILEIQQSSNATYRLYDYNRKDKDGQLRPLHLKKAYANISFKASDEQGNPLGPWQEGKGFKKQLLEECKYFSVWAYSVTEQTQLVMDDSTFWSIVVVSGEGVLETEGEKQQIKAGDSLFLPAGRRAVQITGQCHFVLSHV